MSSVVPQTPFNEYPNVNGSTTVFPYEFQLLSAADLVVTVDGATVPSSEFVLSGVGNQAGGDVTFNTAPLVGSDVLLSREIALERTTDYQYNGPLKERTVDNDFNRLWQAFQGFFARLSGAIRLPYPEQTAELPPADQRKGKFLAFDSVTGAVTLVVAAAESALALGLALASSAGASLVGYIRAGTNAVARTVEDRLRDADTIFDSLTAAQRAAIRAEAGGASAECSTNYQLALDSSTAGYEWHPTGRYMLAKTLQIKSGTKRVTLKGGNRIRTLLSPSVVDVKQAPVNINALFVVQDNNAHFCMENLRFYSDVAYTGYGVYAKEGGGADLSAQALYSAIFRNLWLEFASPNNGFFVGALQNSVVQTITAENMKSLFQLEGSGNADVSFTDIKAYNCFDPIITQTADTVGSALMTVNDVHIYTHNRGRAIDVQNWVSSITNGVIYEAAIGNLGQTGLFRYKDCQDLIVTNSMAMMRAGVALASRGIDVTSSLGVTTRIKFKGIKINADIGLRLFGPGAFDLSFEDCDFTDCVTACAQIATACSGMIRTRGCRFNRSQGTIFLSTAANDLGWISDDDEFLDAGLGGGAASRCITLATTANVVFNNPRIGKIAGGAAAGYFIEATGTGLVTINNPIWEGTPPSGYITGSQFPINVVQSMQQPTGVQRVNAASATVWPSTGTVIVDNAGACALTLPSVATNTGRRLTVLTRQPQAVNSSAPNVVPRVGGVAVTGILTAVDGAWVEMVCEGGAWEIVQGS